MKPAATVATKGPSYSARGVVRSLEAEKVAGVHVGDSVEFSFHDDGEGNLVLETLRKAR